MGRKLSGRHEVQTQGELVRAALAMLAVVLVPVAGLILVLV